MVFQSKANLTPNAIGERSQGAIAAEVMKYGYIILVPFGEAHRYDMVIEKDGQFSRLQCKTGRYINGVIKFNACSVNSLVAFVYVTVEMHQNPIW